MLLPFRRLATASLGLLLVGSAACTKAGPAPEATLTSETSHDVLLVGRWVLSYTTGGFAGSTQPADPTRKQEIIFTSTGQASELLNGIVVSTSAYALTAAPAINGRTETFVTYAPNSNSPLCFISKLSASGLVLTQNAHDGFDLHYTRR